MTASRNEKAPNRHRPARLHGRIYSNDAKLGIHLGDTVSSYFAGAWTQSKGGVAHLNAATGNGGTDFLGTPGDLQ